MAERLNLLLAANEPALIQKINKELSSSLLNLGKITSVDCLDDLLSYPDKNEIDVLLMDVDYALPDIEGNLRLIQDQFPNKPVVALVDIENFKTARKAVSQGVQGFAIKSELIGSILECVILQAIDHSKTRALLHENNRQIKNLMDNLPGIAYRCRNDKNWTMEFISAGCRMLTGYDADDILNNNKISFEELIHPEDRQRVRDEIQEALMENRQYQLEFRIRTADNQEKWVWEQGCLTDTNEKIQTLEGFISDISDRRQREFHLRSLIEIGNLIRELSNQDNLGDKVLARIASLYGFSSSAVASVLKQNNSMEFDFAQGGWAALKHKEFIMKDSKCWKAILDFNPVAIDANKDLGVECQLLRNNDNRYLAFIPLSSEGHLTKLLLFGRNLRFSDNEMQVFTAIGDLISYALARVDLIARLEKQLQRMESLHSVDQAISGVFDISVINRVILDEVRKGLGADAAAIMDLNSLTNTLDLNGDVGFRSSFLSTKKLPISTSIAGKVLMSRSVFEAPDLSKAPVEIQIKNWDDEGFKAYFAIPLIVKGKPVGVMEVFFRNPFYPDQEWLKFFESLASQAAVAYDSHHTFSDLQRVKQNLANTYNAALETWSKSLELTNIESKGHIQRVTHLTMKLAKELGVDENELPAIERGALLHDIGKLGILDEILLKKGKLSETEWHEIERHPVIARDLLSGVTLLKDAIDIPFSHHENWDGSGYPQGLKAEAIPKAARIFAVVETYDALLSDKPYRKAWTKENAIDYLKQEKGKKFDPKIIDAFLAFIK